MTHQQNFCSVSVYVLLGFLSSKGRNASTRRQNNDSVEQEVVTWILEFLVTMTQQKKKGINYCAGLAD
jgi:hypothetical protein